MPSAWTRPAGGCAFWLRSHLAAEPPAAVTDKAEQAVNALEG
jgi:hypothetical protein